MRNPISLLLLLLLSLLLLCDRSAAGSFDSSSLDTEPEARDEDARDTRLSKERPKQASHHHERSAVTEFPCPDAAAIAPCVCTFDKYEHIDLDCTLVRSEQELAAVFQQEFPVKDLHEFVMTNNSAIKVLGNIFNGVTFKFIEIYPGPFVLEEVTEDFLLDNKLTLTELQIRISKLTSDSFPFAILSQMENLNHLLIQSSLLTVIPPITAPKIASLFLIYGFTEILEEGTFAIHEWDTELNVYQNEIATIESGSFFFADQNSTDSSGTLKFRLTFNQIQSLQAGTFPLRNSYAIIDLEDNQIASIEPGAFVLPAVTDHFSVDLSIAKNQLMTIDEDVFGDVMPYLNYLYLNDNPLVCGCDIAWLVTNDDFMSVVYYTYCANGTSLHDLDPNWYAQNC